jgi:sterol desaturase/sphingolipid hydroxylase (fatty acid hydroxylase superfamily)
MNLFDELVVALQKMQTWEIAGWLVLENAAIFVLTLLIGNWLVNLFKTRPVSFPPPANRLELGLGLSTILLNSFVTILGLLLWQQNLIVLRTVIDGRVLLDVLVLFFVMDFLMYLLHRVAHLPPFYALLHQTHHRFDKVRPLTLFALNPLENLSFGLLWLVVLLVYPASWAGITVYLTLNVLFGLVGHLGVEPLPGSWLKIPLLNCLTTSTFHAQHHRESGFNFGFYTLLWDRLFGTLNPRYLAEFGKLPALEQAEETTVTV